MTMQLIPLHKIEEAAVKLAPYIRKTPLIPFDLLKADRMVLLKCEHLQVTGSFKIRGAANCILENLEQAKKTGVITASAGNHAQGVAAICHYLGVSSTIIMPTATPPIKVQNTRRWGAEAKLFGSVYDESFEHAMEIAEEKGLVFIHPFRDPAVITGQGTIGLELIESTDFSKVEAVIVSIGGGGLISGIASILKAKFPKVKIYGVTAANAPSVYESVKAKKIMVKTPEYTLAEGVSTKKADAIMLDRLVSFLDGIYSIQEEAISHAIAMLAEHAKMVVEGAGVLPVAAIVNDMIPEKNVVAILSGGNIDLPVLSNVLQRGLAEQGRLVRLLITISDRPGGLHNLTGVFAELGANIVQVYHQRATLHTKISEAEIEVDLETRGSDHTKLIIDELMKRRFKIQRLS